MAVAYCAMSSYIAVLPAEQAEELRWTLPASGECPNFAKQTRSVRHYLCRRCWRAIQERGLDWRRAGPREAIAWMVQARER